MPVLEITTFIAACALLGTSLGFAYIYAGLRWEQSPEGRSAMELAVSMALLGAYVITGVYPFLAASVLLGLVASAERLRALVNARRRARAALALREQLNAVDNSLVTQPDEE